MSVSTAARPGADRDAAVGAPADAFFIELRQLLVRLSGLGTAGPVGSAPFFLLALE
jgi:hypothetical protein